MTYPSHYYTCWSPWPPLIDELYRWPPLLTSIPAEVSDLLSLMSSTDDLPFSLLYLLNSLTSSLLMSSRDDLLFSLLCIPEVPDLLPIDELCVNLLFSLLYLKSLTSSLLMSYRDDLPFSQLCMHMYTSTWSPWPPPYWWALQMTSPSHSHPWKKKEEKNIMSIDKKKWQHGNYNPDWWIK